MTHHSHKESISTRAKQTCFKEQIAYINSKPFPGDEIADVKIWRASNGEAKLGEGEWGAGSEGPALFLSQIAAETLQTKPLSGGGKK